MINIEIPRSIFDEDIIKDIQTEGLSLYSYFLYNKNINNCCNCSVKSIMEYMNHDYENRPNINYGRSKSNKITTIKDKKTIKKYIEKIEESNLIKIINKSTLNSGSVNDNLIIQVNNVDSDKIIIEGLIFNNLIHKIGHLGWAIIISTLYFKTFFKKSNEAMIAGLINRNQEASRAYTRLLKELGVPMIKDGGLVYFDFEKYDKTNTREILKSKTKKKKSLSEEDLEKYLIKNLELVEEDMEFINNQYDIKDGFIDILARDKNNTLCIIELKISDSSKDLIYQCAYYPTQFDESTRMITICPNYSYKISKALTNLPYVEKYTYSMKGNDLKTLKIYKCN